MNPGALMIRLPVTLAAALAITLLFGISSPGFAQATAAQATAKAPTRPDLQASDITPLSDWYGLYLQGKKMGYFHIVRDRKDEVVHEGFKMVLRLVARNKKTEIT